MAHANSTRLADVPIYADGTALNRSFHATEVNLPWRAWFAGNSAKLAVSRVTHLEARRFASDLDLDGRLAAYDLMASLPTARISEQVIWSATQVLDLVDAYRALHYGMVLRTPGVEALVTYDPYLASLVSSSGLEIISPGQEPEWWAQELAQKRRSRLALAPTG